MSQLPSTQRVRQRRADAERSIAAILDAAIEVLSERSDASMEDIARVAGVARQTVYAHYASREALLRAVQDRAVAETVAAIDAAELDAGSPAEALDRLVTAGWRTLERYPLLMDLRAPMSPEEEHALHGPILERLGRLVRRGQRAGVFDRRLPAAWLLAAFLGLSHAAGEEVAAGRMSAEEAAKALRRSIARVFGVEGG
ncbi:MAG: TetR/AcrR family transcriptional regulator [Gaiellaceae bacterium]